MIQARGVRVTAPHPPPWVVQVAPRARASFPVTAYTPTAVSRFNGNRRAVRLRYKNKFTFFTDRRLHDTLHLAVSFTPFCIYVRYVVNVIEQVFYCECVGYVTTLVWRLAGRGGGRYWVRGYRGVDAKWIPPPW